MIGNRSGVAFVWFFESHKISLPHDIICNVSKSIEINKKGYILKVYQSSYFLLETLRALTGLSPKEV